MSSPLHQRQHCTGIIILLIFITSFVTITSVSADCTNYTLPLHSSSISSDCQAGSSQPNGTICTAKCNTGYTSNNKTSVCGNDNKWVYEQSCTVAVATNTPCLDYTLPTNALAPDTCPAGSTQPSGKSCSAICPSSTTSTGVDLCQNGAWTQRQTCVAAVAGGGSSSSSTGTAEEPHKSKAFITWWVILIIILGIIILGISIVFVCMRWLKLNRNTLSAHTHLSGAGSGKKSEGSQGISSANSTSGSTPGSPGATLDNHSTTSGMNRSPSLQDRRGTIESAGPPSLHHQPSITPSAQRHVAGRPASSTQLLPTYRRGSTEMGVIMPSDGMASPTAVDSPTIDEEVGEAGENGEQEDGNVEVHIVMEDPEEEKPATQRLVSFG